MSVRCLHLNFVPSSAPSSSIPAPYQQTHLALAPTRGPGRPACRALRANPSLPTQLFPPSRFLSLFVPVSCFTSVFINLYLLVSDTTELPTVMSMVKKETVTSPSTTAFHHADFISPYLHFHYRTGSGPPSSPGWRWMKYKPPHLQTCLFSSEGSLYSEVHK